MHAIKVLVVSGALALAATAASAQSVNWDKVDAALGRKAAVSGDVHRYGFPRTDLNVTLDGVTIKPAFALGGWVAFKPAHGGAMVMGDLVLLETEITPVLTTAGTTLGFLLGGAVVVETVFSWPGIGRLAAQGILNNDSQLVVGFTLFVATMMVLVNLVVDVLYAVIDPRVRY